MPKKRKKSLLTLSERISTSHRHDIWLLARLESLWSNHFQDVGQTNPVFIKFGRYSRFRLGSIRLDKAGKKTYITITGMFRDEAVPVEVVDQTIAHELVHYTHGFSSFRPRLHRFPHEGGIVNKELKNRGLDNLTKAYRKWVRGYREKLVKH